MSEKNPVNVQLYLRKSDVCIVCPKCQATMLHREVLFTSLTNFPFVKGNNPPWGKHKNADEVTIQKCKHCGTVVKVTAQIKAEIVTDSKNETNTEIATVAIEESVEPEQQTKIDSFAI